MDKQGLSSSSRITASLQREAFILRSCTYTSQRRPSLFQSLSPLSTNSEPDQILPHRGLCHHLPTYREGQTYGLLSQLRRPQRDLGLGTQEIENHCIHPRSRCFSAERTRPGTPIKLCSASPVWLACTPVARQTCSLTVTNLVVINLVFRCCKGSGT